MVDAQKNVRGWWEAGVPTRCHGCVNISDLLAKANKELSAVLFHLVGRVAPYRAFVTLQLIDKAGTEPLQVVIG